MPSACTHSRSHQREASPSHTQGLQAAYRSEVELRLRRLRDVLRETIAENDALRLDEIGPRVQAAGDVGPREDFEFDINPAKQSAFREQLREWIDRGILEPLDDDAIQDGQHWTGAYALSGYKAGVEYADGLLVQRGREIPGEDAVEVVTRPIHVSTLRTIYLRNYQNLQGITQDIDRSLSSILAESLRDGVGSDKTASRLTREVEDINRTRGRTFARTELMHAHNTASLTRYDAFGVEEVDILTHTPCEVCRGIEASGPYTIGEAEGLLPAHPNCVCTYAPVIP